MPRVVIIGAGIGGLSLAAFLRKNGYEDVQIYESRSKESLHSEWAGNGMHIYFQCFRMLKQANLPIETISYPCDLQFRRDDGKVMNDLSRQNQLKIEPSLKALNCAAYSVFREDIYKMLLKATPDESLHCGNKCVSVEETEDFVTVCFEDGSKVEADLLVGADGIHSKVALTLEKKPRPLKKIGNLMLQGFSEYHPEVDCDTNHGLESWTLHRKGGTFGVVPALIPDTGGKKGCWFWMSPPSTDVNPDNVNTKEEMWDMLQQQAARYSFDRIGLTLRSTKKESLCKWTMQDRDPLSEGWVSRNGRIALLGDSAHAAQPSTGYGAGMTIEDAYWLSEELGPDPTILSRPQDRIDALMKYEKRRARYTSNIVKEGRVLLALSDLRNPILIAIVNFFWWSGIAGFFAARKFVAVFKQGLQETKWSDEERKNQKLTY